MEISLYKNSYNARPAGTDNVEEYLLGYYLQFSKVTLWKKFITKTTGLNVLNTEVCKQIGSCEVEFSKLLSVLARYTGRFFSYFTNKVMAAILERLRVSVIISQRNLQS